MASTDININMGILNTEIPESDGSDININMGNIGTEIPENFTSNNGAGSIADDNLDPELLQRFHVGIMIH